MALIVCSWSGGIDSTALIGQMLRAGHEVVAISLEIYGGAFADREARARQDLKPYLREISPQVSFINAPAEFLWCFSPDGTEIPRRNRLIIDYLIAQYPMVANIGLGEYIGADSWVVRDHVGAADADARALAAYIYHEYGLAHRLWTLSDFGEARFKHQRLDLGIKAYLPMHLTTNCLTDSPIHCGRCYKCVERSVAFRMLEHDDPTEYQRDPRQSEAYQTYLQQMRGEPAILPANAFPDLPMPRRA